MNTIKLLWQLYLQKKNTSKTTVQIRELQEKKLRNLLRHAYKHSVYYRRVFDEAGITEERLESIPLKELPSLSKADFLANFDDIVADSCLTQNGLRFFDAKEDTGRSPYQGKYHVIHSSGSTGRPGYFVYDEEAWSSMLVGIVRGALWNMSMPEILKFLAGRPRIAFIAATDGRYAGVMSVGDGIESVGASALNLDVNTPLEVWSRQIQEFGPNMIIGYPSAVKIVCQLMERGEIKLNVHRIVTCGEPLGNSLRSYLERIFKADVINFYGSSESLALGLDSGDGEGMLLFDDMNIIEIEDGAMYLTCLYNKLQPLIRYRLSDRMVLEEAGGRYPFTKAERLLGREEDILWFEDNTGKKEFLHPLSVEGFCIDGLKDYQFCQTGKDSFEVRIETAHNISTEDICIELRRQLRKILLDKGLDYVQFSIHTVHEIRPDSLTGKKRLVVAGMGKGGMQDEANTA